MPTVSQVYEPRACITDLHGSYVFSSRSPLGFEALDIFGVSLKPSSWYQRILLITDRLTKDTQTIPLKSTLFLPLPKLPLYTERIRTDHLILSTSKMATIYRALIPSIFVQSVQNLVPTCTYHD